MLDINISEFDCEDYGSGLAYVVKIHSDVRQCNYEDTDLVWVIVDMLERQEYIEDHSISIGLSCERDELIYECSIDKEKFIVNFEGHLVKEVLNRIPYMPEHKLNYI